VELREFREQLAAAMVDQKERPFVGDGSPFKAKAFIVGRNPATPLDREFWYFWDDTKGFDRAKFDAEYHKVRPTKTGTRPRIEAISSAFALGECLETNIYSIPTTAGHPLRAEQKRTVAFEFLLRTLKPRALYIYGACTAQWFNELCPALEGLRDDELAVVEFQGRPTAVMLRRHAALYTASILAAAEFGRQFASAERGLTG
jgi:hypothetical protein